MKKKILKNVGIGVFLFTLVANLQFAFLDYGLKGNGLGYELFARTTSGGGSNGCYYTTTIKCYEWFGERQICNFTGTYGSPYECFQTYCLNHDGGDTRRCVQP